MRPVSALLLAGVFLLGAEAGHASFEMERPGARASGMGGAFTAVADDADALFYNAAGLAGVRQVGVSMEFSRLLAGLDEDTVSENRLAYLQPVRNFGVLGLGWDRVGWAGVYQENLITAGLGFTVDTAAQYAVGAGLKILQVEYQDAESVGANSDFFNRTSKMGITLDLGGKMELPGGFSLGLSLANLTQPNMALQGGYALPLHLRAGCAYTYAGGVSAVDLLSYGGNQRLSAGSEYWWFEHLLGARVGAGLGNNQMAEMTGGLSCRLQLAGWSPQMDYAFVVPLGDFAGAGATHRVNLSVTFGNPESENRAVQPGRAWLAKGNLAFEQGKREEALEAWERAAEVMPQDQALAAKIEALRFQLQRASEIKLYLKQGREFQKNASYQNALAAYQKVLAIEPRHPEALAQAAAVQSAMQKMTEAQRQQQQQQERLAAERARQNEQQAAREAWQTAGRALEKARHQPEIRRLFSKEISRLEKQWAAAGVWAKEGELERAQVSAQTVAAEVEKLYQKIPRFQAQEKHEKRALETAVPETTPAPAAPAPTVAAPAPAEVGKTAKAPVDQTLRRRARGAYGRTVKLMLDIDKLQGQKYFPEQFSALQGEISRIKILVASEDYPAAIEYAEGLFPRLEDLKKQCAEKKKAREVMPTNW